MSAYVKSAIHMVLLIVICIFIPTRALEAFDIEFSHFNLVNFNLTLDPESMFDPNISVVYLEGVGKYGYDSNKKPVSGVLCIPKYKNPIFRHGCQPSEYAVCRSRGSPYIAIVDRGSCDMVNKADAAYSAAASGLIIIETSAVVDPMQLKEYDQQPHTGKFHQTYKTTSLDHSFIREAPRREKSMVPYVLCTKAVGRELQEFVLNGSNFQVYMFDGGIHGTELRVPSSSLLLVFVAFIVLTIISMIWLIFYYVQRFRYHHHQDRVIGQVRKATKKAFRMMPTRILRDGDPELESNFGRCAICLEAYKLWDMVRDLPCSHIYHKSCVDAWLNRKPACPNCKSNVLKALGFDAEYDWTCLDANSEPDAISLLDIMPTVVSVQIFAPNTAAPSRFITELTTIPHACPSTRENQSSDSSVSRQQHASSGSKRADSSDDCGMGVDRVGRPSTTVATVELATNSGSLSPVARSSSHSSRMASTSAADVSCPLSVTLEVETHSPSSPNAVSPATTTHKSCSTGPSSASSAGSATTNGSGGGGGGGRSLKSQIKKGVLAAIGGDSKA